LKNIWLHSVRFYIGLGLFFYYRRIHVKHRERVPLQEPLLFVSNHNNALMDALLIATQSGRFSYFLTRASVFKKPMINALLRSLNMIPVYRVRDGWHTVTNNTAVFANCSKCLSQGEAVALFPEGNHHINRTLRPLSKGFTRIVFETLTRFPSTDLKLIPIGLNYEQADAFSDSVAVYFGAEISAKAYLESERTSEALRLKHDVWQAITQLTTHIPADTYTESLSRLQAVNADFLNPEAVNRCLNSNFKKCSFKRTQQPKILKAFFKFFMIVLLLGPYVIWKFLAEPKIKEVEFVATFRFGLTISLVPLWLFVVAIILAVGMGFQVALIYVSLSLLISLLAVKL